MQSAETLRLLKGGRITKELTEQDIQLLRALKNDEIWSRICAISWRLLTASEFFFFLMKIKLWRSLVPAKNPWNVCDALFANLGSSPYKKECNGINNKDKRYEENRKHEVEVERYDVSTSRCWVNPWEMQGGK